MALGLASGEGEAFVLINTHLVSCHKSQSSLTSNGNILCLLCLNFWAKNCLNPSLITNGVQIFYLCRNLNKVNVKLQSYPKSRTIKNPKNPVPKTEGICTANMAFDSKRNLNGIKFYPKSPKLKAFALQTWPLIAKLASSPPPPPGILKVPPEDQQLCDDSGAEVYEDAKTLADCNLNGKNSRAHTPACVGLSLRWVHTLLILTLCYCIVCVVLSFAVLLSVSTDCYS